LLQSLNDRSLFKMTHLHSATHRSLLRRAATLAVGIFTTVATTLSAAAPTDLISPWRAYPVGAFPNIGPTSIAVGDLNGDGLNDAVVGLNYFGGPGISVLFGTAEGGFSEPTVYPNAINDSVSAVSLSDVNGDGTLDVLATMPDTFGFSAIVDFYRNNGDGTLSDPRSFASGEGPSALVVADFDGDGFDDVVTADGGFLGNGESISVLLHNGLSGQNAGFLPPTSYSTDDEQEEIEAADLDGDGDLDVVIGRGGFGANGGTAVLFNQGDATFGPPTFYEQVPAATGVSSAIELVDVDLDGDVDLIAAASSNLTPSAGLLGLRRNDGSGQFGAAEILTLGESTFTPASLDVADLNGDGWPDLVATTPSGRAVDGYNVLLNDAAGGFRPVEFYRGSKQTTAAALFDVDGDLNVDIVTVANDSALLTIHRNPGKGIFLRLPQYDVGSFTDGIDRADIDGDGDLDIVTSDTEIRVLENRGGGVFSPFVVYDVTSGADDVKLRDLDNDGFPDLIWDSSTSSDIGIALNQGDGTFGVEILRSFGTVFFDSFETFDIDGDGFLDIVIADSTNSGGFRFGRNLGNGLDYQTMPFFNASGSPSGIAGADLDGDGEIDLLTQMVGGVTSFLGLGNFDFESGIATGGFGVEFALADFDNDGFDDIALHEGQISTATSWVATMIGFGDGDFGFPLEKPGPVGLESPFQISSDLDTGDLTGDGKQDLILTNNAPSDIAIFPGTETGTVSEAVRYGAGYSASETIIGDLTGDGVDDVATIISLPPSGIGEALVVLPGRLEPPALALEVQGKCPATLTVLVTGAVPAAPISLLASGEPGTAPVPPALSCAGTPLDLARPLFVLGTAVADGNGSASLEVTPAEAACNRGIVQAIDLSSCSVSPTTGL